jgi:hypothetical protein
LNPETALAIQTEGKVPETSDRKMEAIFLIRDDDDDDDDKNLLKNISNYNLLFYTLNKHCRTYYTTS